MLSPHQLRVSVHQSYDVEQAVRVRESLFLFRILGEQEGTQNVTRNLILSIIEPAHIRQIFTAQCF